MAKRPSTRPRRTAPSGTTRYTIDASVFVNAFNPHEEGHAESLRVLTVIQERGDPIVVPALLVPEIASAIARATGDGAGALQYALAIVGLPQLTLVSITFAMGRQAAELAATHRLRGADAIYLAVARRYGTTLVSRDREQRARGVAVTACLTPEDVLSAQ